MIVEIALASMTSPRDWSQQWDEDDDDAILATALELLTRKAD